MNINTRRYALAVAAATSLFAEAASAHAQCNLKSLQVVSEGVVVSYDPFDREGNRTTLPIRISTAGCDGARLQLVVVPEIGSLSSSGELEATNGSNSLAVSMTVGGAPARVVSNAIDAFAVSGRPARLAASSGQLEGQGVGIELAYGADVSPGRYRARASLVARALDEDGVPGQSITTPFFVEIDVQPSFRIAAGLERQRLWLGELTEGKRSQPLTFLAFSNTRYILKVRSEHQGRMTLNGSRISDSPGVPYELSISDRDVDWENGEGELEFLRPQFLLRTHEVVATTGEVEDRRPAGDYKDWVTIEISPLIS